MGVYKLVVMEGDEKSRNIENMVRRHLQAYIKEGTFGKDTILEITVMYDRDSLNRFGIQEVPALYVGELGQWYQGSREIEDYIRFPKGKKYLPELVKAFSYPD